MDLSLIAKQMIDFQKTTFDNTFNTVVMLQDHTEKVASTLFEQTTLFPEEGKRIISQWTEILKKGRDDMKTAMDENFSKLGDLLSSLKEPNPEGKGPKQ